HTETCAEFLHPFYRESTRGPRRVVGISDPASYHHSRIHPEWRAEVADRFERSFLPAASPTLDPIERVWKRTRRPGLHPRYFPKLEDRTTAVEHPFAGWRRGNETLRRLGAITWGAVFRRRRSGSRGFRSPPLGVQEQPSRIPSRMRSVDGASWIPRGAPPRVGASRFPEYVPTAPSWATFD
ncbi:transposase related protein, partial [mine drainage metagenome]